MKKAMGFIVIAMFLGACGHMHHKGGHGCCKDGQCSMKDKESQKHDDCGCSDSKTEKAEKPADSK